MVTCRGSAERSNTNEQLGRGQRIEERWDAYGFTGVGSGLKQGTLHTINEWRDAWGFARGAVKATTAMAGEAARSLA